MFSCKPSQKDASKGEREGERERQEYYTRKSQAANSSFILPLLSLIYTYIDMANILADIVQRSKQFLFRKKEKYTVSEGRGRRIDRERGRKRQENIKQRLDN